MIFGIMKDFRPKIKELKVFDKNGNAKIDQADELNDKIMDLQKLSRTNPILKMVSDKIFGQGFPMVPFPDVERCLGLKPKDSTMKILDGYAILAFDYSVRPSNENCLFDIKGSLADKEMRMAMKNKGIQDFDLSKATKKLKAIADMNMNNFQKLPPLPDFDITNLDLKDVLEISQKAKQGFDMIQNNIDHPLIKEGLNKFNDIEAVKKLKDIDVGETVNKIKDLTNNLQDTKKHAENFFKIFQ